MTGRIPPRLRTALTALAAALLTVLLAAPTASAHTELESSSPKAGSRLARTPATVRLVFSESVDLADVHVAAGGKQLSVARAAHGDGGGNAVEVVVPKATGQDRLTLSWHVLDMEDGHSTSGSLSFPLTAHAKTSGTAGSDDAQAAPRESEAVHTAWVATRWAGYLALALHIGGIAFLALLWPQGAHDRRTRRILTLSWTAGLAASLLGPGLQGAYGAMGTFGDVLRRSTYTDLLNTEVGIVAACRVLLWVLAAVVLAALLHAASGPPDRRAGGSAPSRSASASCAPPA